MITITKYHIIPNNSKIIRMANINNTMTINHVAARLYEFKVVIRYSHTK